MVDVRSFNIKSISNMENVIVERIIIDFKGKIIDGYLHLLEHLWVRSNKKWLDEFEHGMNIFNAMTEKNRITFVFMYSDCRVNTNTLVFDMEFNEQDFILEKNTIFEERKMYSNDVNDVNTILGSLDAIAAFDLTVLEKMLQVIDYEIIKFKFSSMFEEEKIQKDDIRAIDCSSVIRVDNSLIKISKSYESKVLLALLRIFKVTNDNFCYSFENLNDSFEIHIESYKDFDFMILNRDKVLKRYRLLLSNLQLEIEDTIYLFDLFGYIPSISEFWHSFNWEVLT